MFIPDTFLMLSGGGAGVEEGRGRGGAGCVFRALLRHALVTLGLPLVHRAVLVHLNLLPRFIAANLLYLLQLFPGDEPPVEGGDEEGEELDAGADADVLESEHLDVIDETAAAGAFAGLSPEKTRGVDHVAKQDRAGDVAEQAEDDELDAQRECLLLLADTAEDDHEDGHLGDGHEQRHEEEQDHEGEDHITRGVAGALGGHGDLGHAEVPHPPAPRPPCRSRMRSWCSCHC